MRIGGGVKKLAPGRKKNNQKLLSNGVVLYLQSSRSFLR